MERERLAQENELSHSPERYRQSKYNQGRRRHNSTGRSGVEERRTMEEGRHELWLFYQGGVRREYLFTPDGLLKEQQNQKEINEKKEKPSPKVSLNEVMWTYIVKGA